jgi:hypothetical protein
VHRHTDWREPKLFTLYLLDEKGEIINKFKLLRDAIRGNHEAMFGLLENYSCPKSVV